MRKKLLSLAETISIQSLVIRLSLKDLLHERILTLCIALAIAAVLFLLMTLFGLKYGTIQTIRHRLIQDPRNREIRPMISRTFTQDWFEQIRARSDVAFVVPMTRKISATIHARMKNQEEGSKSIQLDVIPTGKGDVLILENNSDIPKNSECILTYAAAKALGAKSSDNIIATVRRIEKGRFETAKKELKVIDVLPYKATGLKAIFVQLDILEAVERFKDGIAVPEYGWQGAVGAAFPKFDGLFAVFSDKIDKKFASKLINKTGFVKIERILPGKLLNMAGIKFANSRFIYLLSTEQTPVGKESIQAVRNTLGEKNSCLIPWVKGIPGNLTDQKYGKRTAQEFQGLSIPNDKACHDIQPNIPWNDTDESRAANVVLTGSLDATAGSYKLEVTRNRNILTVPVSVLKDPAIGQRTYIPLYLAGMLRLFQSRNITYDTKINRFRLIRGGYAGFRLYATSIDEVPGLQNFFDDQEIAVHTEAERIRDVMELDYYLGIIFWLIATVGILGGTSVLAASLYASVRRKQKEISVLRLIGFSRLELFPFSIYQGGAIGIGSFVVALGAFEAMSKVINKLFQSHLGESETLCYLTPLQLLETLAGVITVAALASALAAWQTSSIDPAEALRDE